jgi:hypothetical protein
VAGFLVRKKSTIGFNNPGKILRTLFFSNSTGAPLSIVRVPVQQELT